MTEWIKGQPSINGQFWRQIARVEGNGKVTTTFVTIRGKRGDEKFQIKQFVEQINRYTETTIAVDLRALTQELDDYRGLSENVVRLFEGMRGVNLKENTQDDMPIAGTSVDPHSDGVAPSDELAEVKTHEGEGNLPVRALL